MLRAAVICPLIQILASLRGRYIQLCSVLHTHKMSSLSRVYRITRSPFGSSQKKNSDGTFSAFQSWRGIDRSKFNHVQSAPLQERQQTQNDTSSSDGTNRNLISYILCSTAEKDLQLKNEKIAELFLLSVKQKSHCQEKIQSWIRLLTIMQTQFVQLKSLEVQNAAL